MRKIHVKVVLDIMAVSDDSIISPEASVVDAILAANIVAVESDGVDILDVSVEHYEVTDSR